MSDGKKNLVGDGKAIVAEKLHNLTAKKKEKDKSLKASENYYGKNTGGMGPAKSLDPE